MSEGDNLADLLGDNCNPFKGPFKGKGANRQALRELEALKATIDEEIDCAIHRFNQTFAKPQPVHLRRLKTRTSVLLWWRLPGKSGNFIRLFDSEKGAEILKPLMPETQQMLLAFDQQRIHMNFLSTVAGSALGAYRMRERDLLILQQYEAKKA